MWGRSTDNFPDLIPFLKPSLIEREMPWLSVDILTCFLIRKRGTWQSKDICRGIYSGIYILESLVDIVPTLITLRGA